MTRILDDVFAVAGVYSVFDTYQVYDRGGPDMLLVGARWATVVRYWYDIPLR